MEQQEERLNDIVPPEAIIRGLILEIKRTKKLLKQKEEEIKDLLDENLLLTERLKESFFEKNQKLLKDNENLRKELQKSNDSHKEKNQKNKKQNKENYLLRQENSFLKAQNKTQIGIISRLKDRLENYGK